MSLPHHGDKPEESELLKRFREMQDGVASRKWPEGRVSGEDDGETVFRIGSDANKGLIQIEFPTPTQWVAMPPQTAIEMAQLLIRHARAISKEPIRISLH